jgi:hypothetical protein
MEEEVTRGIEVRARGRVASQKAYLARERAKKARADQIAGRVSRFLFTELCTELAVMTGGERKRIFEEIVSCARRVLFEEWESVSPPKTRGY